MLLPQVGQAKPTRFELETQLIWHEARSEPLEVQQLVLDTARNRSTMCSCSLQNVLTKKGQYPWATRLKTWKLSTEQAEFGFKFLSKRSPVNSGYVFFNHVPLDFTKKNVKHGNLFFAVR